MRYLFFVHHAYSLEVLRPLNSAASGRGDETAWYFCNDRTAPGWAHIRLAGVAEALAFRPDAVFSADTWVPYFFPGLKVQVFHGLADNRVGKGVRYPEGGRPGDDSGHGLHYKIREPFDLYCTHSDYMTRTFVGLQRPSKSFAVHETGWPKLDPLFSMGDGATKTEGNGAALHRPVVLYASTFNEPLTSAPFVAETLEKLSRTGEWEWIVTLHPLTHPAIVRRYRSIQGPHMTFHESRDGVLPLLRRADVMLSDTSSAWLEFMHLDRPVVTFRTGVPGPHVLDVRRTEAIRPAIARALQRPPGLLRAARAFVETVHPYRDGRSSDRVLDATRNLLERRRSLPTPRLPSLRHRLRARARLGYLGRGPGPGPWSPAPAE